MPGSREGGGFQVWLCLWSLTSMSPLGAAHRGCAAPGLVVTSGCLSQTPFPVICRQQLEATPTNEVISIPPIQAIEENTPVILIRKKDK